MDTGKQNHPTNSSAVLSIDSVTKRYGRLLALDSVSLEARKGEALALWGANGAGKTTLIKATLGLVDFKGRILVAGHDARREGKDARRQIGYVPQEAVHYDMSVRATMTFYARLKKADPKRIPLLLDSLGLREHLHKPVPALSGGLKQRLALAVALLSDPALLLLDEPTANLDAQGRSDYLSLLTSLRKQQKTILFASHRTEEVEALADRVLIMDSGCIIEEISPTNLRKRLSPGVELTFWVGSEQRPKALRILQDSGLQAHMNGGGTVVVRLEGDQKLEALRLLVEQGVEVSDFDLEKVGPWN